MKAKVKAELLNYGAMRNTTRLSEIFTRRSFQEARGRVMPDMSLDQVSMTSWENNLSVIDDEESCEGKRMNHIHVNTRNLWKYTILDLFSCASI